MNTVKYEEIVAFLNSPCSAPEYPQRIQNGSSRCKSGKEKDANRRKSNRKDFRRRCSKYTVKASVLYRFVNLGTAKKQQDKEATEDIIFKVRVARCEDVNEELFKQFHHNKGHIGQRQGRETLRRHWFFKHMEK